MKLSYLYAMAVLLLLTACQGTTQQEGQELSANRQEVSSSEEEQTAADDDNDHFQPLISEFIPEVSLLIEQLIEYPTQLQDADELLQKVSVPENARLSRAAALACRLHFALTQQNKSQALVYQKALQSHVESMQLDFLRPIAGASIESTSIDSLLILSRRSLSLETAQQFLLNHYRSAYPASRYVLSMWLEQLYLSCLVFEAHPKPSTKKLLAEQKIYLGNLMMYLSFFDRDKQLQQLQKEFEKLMQGFEPITITYDYQRPTTEIQGNVLVVKQNDIMSFRMPEESILQIKEETERLRNYLLQKP